MLSIKTEVGISFIGTFPIKISPSWISQNRAASMAMVLFPAPEGPTKAVIVPGLAVKETSLSIVVVL